jgi:cytochrome c biogenesis protein CcmG, thiol:disulfide interchange protein DsbE
MDATHEQQPDRGSPRVGFWLTLAVLAAGVFVFVLLVTGRGPAPGTEGPAIGRHLMLLNLEPLTGIARPVTLEDLKGHVTLLNFWGTWCPPCVREFPELIELNERFAGESHFKLYLVSCEGSGEDRSELESETLAFLRSRNVKVPTYADPQSVTRRGLVTTLGVELGYPTTLVLDRGGAIRGFWQGYSPGAVREMTELIERLLKASAENKPA